MLTPHAAQATADDTFAGVDVLRHALQGRQVGSTISVDDVRVELATAGVTGNAVGAVFRYAVTSGWLIYLGHRPSTHRVAKGRRVGRYLVHVVPDRVIVPRYPHPSCGHRPGPAGRTCQACDLVEGYHARRQLYLDAVEQQGRGDDRYEPVRPVVTFSWWLRVYEHASCRRERVAA